MKEITRQKLSDLYFHHIGATEQEIMEEAQKRTDLAYKKGMEIKECFCCFNTDNKTHGEYNQEGIFICNKCL